MSSGLSKKRQSSTGKVPHEKQSREITRAFPVFTNSFCVPGFILQLQFSASLDFFIRLFFPCQSFCLLNQCDKLIESLKNVQLHVTFFPLLILSHAHACWCITIYLSSTYISSEVQVPILSRNIFVDILKMPPV